MKDTLYDVMESCNRCGGVNEVSEVASSLYSGMDILSEASTKCEECGFRDYWSHGVFESRYQGLNKSDKYKP